MCCSESCFFENGLKFECSRCSDCCRLSPGFVYLSKSDLARLCARFNLQYKEFVQKYCRWSPYYNGKEVLCLLEKPNYDCILWENGCLAYAARPVQCSTYPFWTWILKDNATWNKIGQSCRGINKGRLWCKEEILSQMELYRHNLPITR